MTELDAVAGYVVPPNRVAAGCGVIEPNMLTLVELDQSQINSILESVPGGASDVQDIYPLAPLQEGMLFHHLMNEQGDTYVLSTLLELQSRAHVELLIDALQKVVERHDILRSAVIWENLPRPVQVVYRRARLPVRELEPDVARDPVERLNELMRPAQQKWNLRAAPLMRLHFAPDRAGEKYFALLQVHHLIADYRTLKAVIGETMACLEGRAQDLPPPTAYRNYVAHAKANARLADAEAFFRRKLGDVVEPTAPFGLLDIHGNEGGVAEFTHALDAVLSREIRAQARGAGVSPARLFHAAWGLVVARTSGRSDVVFGTVLLATQQKESKSRPVFGMSVNTLPLRLQLRDVTALELVHQTNRELIELLNFDETPLTLAQSCSGISGTAPLFTSIFNYRHNQPIPNAQSCLQTGVRVLALGEAWSNYPIALIVDDMRDGFVLTAQTDQRLEPHRIVEYLCVAIQSLVEALARAPDTPSRQISILTESERNLVVDSFNATQVQYSTDRLVHELFEHQAERSPGVVAVVCGNEQLTYSQLNAQANQLAHELLKYGIRRNERVALYLERGVQMIIGLLGILKAGAAYVPLDINHPIDRLAHMIRDSAPVVLITREKFRSALPGSAARVLALDTDELAIHRNADRNPDVAELRLSPNNVAYVIYTSGSTGTPKGVAVEHRNLLNLVQWHCAEFDVREGSRCSAVAAIGFDAAGWEIWPPLSVGATLLIASSEIGNDVEALLSWWASQSLDCGFLPTPIAELILDRDIPRLQTLLVGGDRLRQRPDGQSFSLVNNYGPTEATVVATSGRIRAEDVVLHIGRPIANTQIYILDYDQQPVPVGVSGEMYVGGAGVARGYLNQPELTAERFFADPFSSDPGARIYRTGDLGRWQTDGTIEYIGRNDDQVKIRGFRIELGEIEAQLLLHPEVKEAAAVAHKDDAGETRLVAYVVLANASKGIEVSGADDLRQYLKGVVPEYMVPSALVTLECMPLTTNGKLDRRALPAPAAESYVSRGYEPPQGKVEEALAQIWQRLLRVKHVGRHDSFFELGGNSLSIVQMLEQLRRVGLATTARSVYDNPILAEMGRTLVNAAVDHMEVPPNLIPPACEAITPQMLPLVALEPEQIERIAQFVPGGAANIKDIYPLVSLQEGILFHSLLTEHGGDVYVVPTLLVVSKRERLDALIAALQHVVDRHDVLRTGMHWEQLPQPVQVVHRRAVLPVEEIVLDRHRDPLEQLHELMRPELQRLDLRLAPPMRLRVAADPNSQQWFVVLQLHHIVGDNTSQGIVISEAVAYLNGRAHELPAPVPYRNHVAQVLAHVAMHDAEAFFRAKLGDIDEPTAPFGMSDVKGDGSRTAQAHQALDPVLAKRLRLVARRLGVSAATLFHASWALVVAKTSRRSDVVFGCVLLGRLLGSAGAQQVLGMFINTLPLRLQLQGISAEALIRHTQQELVALLNHEQASLAVAQRCSNIDGSTPLFSALLNYRHNIQNPDADWTKAEGVKILASRGFTNYPIALSIDESEEGFALTAQTDRSIDPHRITGYMSVALHSLMDALERTPRKPALALPILPDHERDQVLKLFNETQAAHSTERLIHELFEAQVERTPDAQAVVHDGVWLTYAQLNGRANQLARYLIEFGVGPDRLVGICLERSAEMIIGVLAALKAGAAYVPLDPNYPAERLQYMIEDAAPQVVLSQRALRNLLPGSCAQVIVMEEKHQDVSGFAETNVPVAERGLRSRHAVYVIYTSGSTGRPKGTVMSHRSMVNLMEWHRQSLCAAGGQRVLQFAALSFDVAFQEIFSTLCTGSTLVLLDERIRRDSVALLELLSSQRIQRLFVPPLMLQSIAEYAKSVDIGPLSLVDVITAGEQLRINTDMIDFFQRLPGCRLHNHYGPTETHVVTALTLAENPGEWPMLPSIGRPIANTQIYILDDEQQPAPKDVPGEIFVAGENVACGYLGRPELTAQRFVANPFSSDSHARMYRTGDLGRWQSDGAIEYLGRNDDQVKIRGHRVEVGEVEAQVAAYPPVKEVAVVAREGGAGERRLVAYVTLREHGAFDVEQLRVHLKAALPEFMVPGAFVVLARMPVTPSGKLNKRELPAPELQGPGNGQYEFPEGNVERDLARIWQELLRVERVGRDDNFFDLGGHSLLALKALFKINQTFGSALRVTDAYENPTIRDLALRINGNVQANELIDLSEEAVLDDDIVLRYPLRSTPAKEVLLTGATGFVGRFLLAQLLQDTDARIHCLVRAQSDIHASSRLKSSLKEWNLWRDDFDSRIVAFRGDMRLPRLGIPGERYELLSRSVDTIYHCATSMNHLETYSMAKAANVGAAKELLRLATSQTTKLVNFLSTLGIFGRHANCSTRVVNELTPIEGEQHRHSQGYIASKWVGEKLFMEAGRRGIPCNIFRLGLIWADTKEGRYDELQHDYRILKSCLLSGYGISNHRYAMPPTPVDYSSRSIVFLANRHRKGRGIFHISASHVDIDDVFERCNTVVGTSLELKELHDWICEVKRLHKEGRSLPVVPLIEFAFSMNEASFNEHQRRTGYAGIRFDCTSTHRELEEAGIVAPALNDELLKRCVETMLSNDVDLREMLECGNSARPVQWHKVIRTTI